MMDYRCPTLRFFFITLALATGVAAAQSQADCKPPIYRQRWHDDIDKAQKAALKADGRADNDFKAGENEEVNFLVTDALTKKTDALQCWIEQDTLSNSNSKVGYLRGLENFIRRFAADFRGQRFNAAYFPAALQVYGTAIAKDGRKESIEELINTQSYDIGNLVLSSHAFNNNTGYKASSDGLLKKYIVLHPDKAFATLDKNTSLLSDTLITAAGYKYPNTLYDYAAANTALGRAIRKIDDPFIKAVVDMANSGGNGQMQFPFLDAIVKGRITLNEINAVKDDNLKYYKLLVKTRMDYMDRQSRGEQITGMKGLQDKLRIKAKEYFIKTINDLHEESDAVRFRILQPLTAQELYYLIVSDESDLYTSSYVKGVYPAMMQKIGNRGDSLLMSVKADRFKKFIKLAAGYNTLSQFLNSFPDKGSAQTLMTAFVNGLEKAQGLEDGVDVADSYASISETLKPVAARMLIDVKNNYDKNVTAGNKRGIVMYDLLYKLFQSATDSTINLSKEFGIPPVYNVPYTSLVNDTGKVVMQVFFYGDADGRSNWADFIPFVSSGAWKKVIDNKYWLMYAATSGKPVYIYANKPLDEESGLIDKAQDSLKEYLAQKMIEPSIIIHRGHSYYAPTTISQIQPAARIVFLGSCGGYNLISNVLRHSSDAHIIASKQVGTRNVNRPFLKLLTDKLRGGNNIDWIPFWREFKGLAGASDSFNDYIPPYKNLGAIFIKACSSAMGAEED